MNTKYRALTAAGLASLALVGCGGDSSGFNGNANVGANTFACDTSTITGVISCINNLIATATLETNLPQDISGVTLATDETSAAIPNP